MIENKEVSWLTPLNSYKPTAEPEKSSQRQLLSRLAIFWGDYFPEWFPPWWCWPWIWPACWPCRRVDWWWWDWEDASRWHLAICSSRNPEFPYLTKQIWQRTSPCRGGGGGRVSEGQMIGCSLAICSSLYHLFGHFVPQTRQFSCWSKFISGCSALACSRNNFASSSSGSQYLPH